MFWCRDEEKHENLPLDAKAKQRQLDTFIRQCKSAGLSLTPQRLAIYSTLAGDASHPSPDDVYRRVKLRHPTISPATVHKTLSTFERHGIITQLTHIHESVRYDPVTTRHHHIICVRCKNVMNLPDEEIGEVCLPDRVRRANKVLGYSVHISVLCASCRNEA